jgi:tellurite resistance protein
MATPRRGDANKLLDAFFFEQDQQLLKAFHQRLEKMDRRAQLAKVSGIHDEAVLDRLMELKVDPETLAAMAVVPLVLVAWADGKVQAEEREAIIAAAKAEGIQPQDGRYPLLEFWLDKRPRPEMFEAWKHYIQGLCQKLDKPQVEELKRDLLRLARDVAQAAGGFLGLGNKISAGERAVLDKLEQAFS